MTGPTLLRAYLDRRKLTQEQFARRAGVPQPQISLWLNGKMRPSIDSAFKVAAATKNRVPAKSWLSDESERGAA